MYDSNSNATKDFMSSNMLIFSISALDNKCTNLCSKEGKHGLRKSFSFSQTASHKMFKVTRPKIYSVTTQQQHTDEISEVLHLCNHMKLEEGPMRALHRPLQKRERTGKEYGGFPFV